jgi:hypothetical protein
VVKTTESKEEPSEFQDEEQPDKFLPVETIQDPKIQDEKEAHIQTGEEGLDAIEPVEEEEEDSENEAKITTEIVNEEPQEADEFVEDVEEELPAPEENEPIELPDGKKEDVQPIQTETGKEEIDQPDNFEEDQDLEKDQPEIKPTDVINPLEVLPVHTGPKETKDEIETGKDDVEMIEPTEEDEEPEEVDEKEPATEELKTPAIAVIKTTESKEEPSEFQDEEQPEEIVPFTKQPEKIEPHNEPIDIKPIDSTIPVDTNKHPEKEAHIQTGEEGLDAIEPADEEEEEELPGDNEVKITTETSQEEPHELDEFVEDEPIEDQTPKETGEVPKIPEEEKTEEIEKPKVIEDEKEPEIIVNLDETPDTPGLVDIKKDDKLTPTNPEEHEQPTEKVHTTEDPVLQDDFQPEEELVDDELKPKVFVEGGKEEEDQPFEFEDEEEILPSVDQPVEENPEDKKKDPTIQVVKEKEDEDSPDTFDEEEPEEKQEETELKVEEEKPPTNDDPKVVEEDPKIDVAPITVEKETEKDDETFEFIDEPEDEDDHHEEPKEETDEKKKPDVPIVVEKEEEEDDKNDEFEEEPEEKDLPDDIQPVIRTDKEKEDDEIEFSFEDDEVNPFTPKTLPIIPEIYPVAPFEIAAFELPLLQVPIPSYHRLSFHVAPTVHTRQFTAGVKVDTGFEPEKVVVPKEKETKPTLTPTGVTFPDETPVNPKNPPAKPTKENLPPLKFKPFFERPSEELGSADRTIIAIQKIGNRLLSGTATQSRVEILIEALRLFPTLHACVQRALEACSPNVKQLLNKCHSETGRECSFEGYNAYRQCSDNEDFIDGACYQKCPAGFKDYKVFCMKSNYIPRPASSMSMDKPLGNFVERVSSNIAAARCSEFGPLYTPMGPNHCRINCPTGWRDHGVYCEKPRRYWKQMAVAFDDKVALNE